MAHDFEQLVGEHIGRIRRIARRYAADASVEDLVQDILLRLWRSYSNFRGEAKLETWVYRVALNAAMTHIKGTIRFRDAQSAIASKTILSNEAPTGANPGDLLESFLNSLGDIDASVLMMYLDGLSPDEMSAFTRDSQRVSPTSLWLYYGVCVVVVSLTYWLCRRESTRKFKPLLERMRELHRDLVTG